MLTKKLNHLLKIKDKIILNNKLYKSSYKTTLKLAELDPEIDQEINDGTKYKKAKSFRPKIEPNLPVYLELSAIKLIEKFKKPNFVKDVKEMINRIYHSQLPPEEKEIHLFSKQIEAKFIAKEKSNIEEYKELSEDEKLKLLGERNRKVEQVVKNKIFSWKEYKWTEHQAVLYLAARLSANFVSTKFVFNEIKHLDPDFKPKTLFDFGSGIGTTMHAANHMWPATIHEHLNIDCSKEMIDLCDLLLKDGNDNNKPIFNNVFYKQFLPVGRTTTYDLVVSAFSLKELPNVDARIHVIENLWHKTEDILVFIEHGNQAGTAAILEARSFILKMNGYDPVAIYNPNDVENENQLDKTTKNPNLHIMAPCPHHYCCPRLNREYGLFCNFNVNYFPFYYGQPKIPLERERISYVVFRKRPKIYKKFVEWPRVVEKPIKNSRNVNLKLCTPEGRIEEINISKGKHSKNTYDCARACKWGDNLPIKINEVDKEQYKKDKELKKQLKKLSNLDDKRDVNSNGNFKPEGGI